MENKLQVQVYGYMTMCRRVSVGQSQTLG